jgi:hypothetical protein
MMAFEADILQFRASFSLCQNTPAAKLSQNARHVSSRPLIKYSPKERTRSIGGESIHTALPKPGNAKRPI